MVNSVRVDVITVDLAIIASNGFEGILMLHGNIRYKMQNSFLVKGTNNFPII